MAKTPGVGQLITAFSHDYYPGTQWKSDMAWDAAEIALADKATGAPAAQLRADLVTAARWAGTYIAQGHPADGDTFNLYDTGAVAEAEQQLNFALGANGWGTSFVVGKIGEDDPTSLAPLLLRAAEAGDDVARTVVSRLADEISVMAITAMRRLGLTGLATPVVLGGGIITARAPLLMENVLRQLREAAPDARS